MLKFEILAWLTIPHIIFLEASEPYLHTPGIRRHFLSDTVCFSNHSCDGFVYYISCYNPQVHQPCGALPIYQSVRDKSKTTISIYLDEWTNIRFLMRNYFTLIPWHNQGIANICCRLKRRATITIIMVTSVYIFCNIPVFINYVRLVISNKYENTELTLGSWN